jgi:tetratricopeptide (TPR) repeat protein
MNDDDVIYELLDRAYESDDADEVAELVERVLELAPDNPEALLLKADLIEDDEGRLPVLEQALEEARRYIEEEELSGDNILEGDMGLVYLGLLQRAAFTNFALENDDRSFELVKELLQYDHEDQAMAKTLYYRILLEREEWSNVLKETMKETARGLGWAYARMVASFMLSDVKGDKNEAGLKKLNKMLWDAVRMAPNVPFYMLGYISDPVDESEMEEDDFHFGLLFEDVWSASREMLNWFSKSIILFGLLSGRFGEESGDMEEILATMNGASDYEELTRRLSGEPEDDNSILDALVDGNYPTKP